MAVSGDEGVTLGGKGMRGGEGMRTLNRGPTAAVAGSLFLFSVSISVPSFRDLRSILFHGEWKY